MMKRLLQISFLSLFILCGAMQSTQAMSLVTGKSQEATAEEPALPVDQLGRSTPRGAVTGFLDAISKEDFDKASQYLDLSEISESARAKKGAILAENLQALLDKGGWFYPTSMLSNDRDGRKDEEALPEDQDSIGNLRGNGKTVDIVVQHVKDPDNENSLIWLISSQTLEQLHDLSEGVEDIEPVINKILPDIMVESKWFGAPAGHWIAAVGLFLLSYLSAWFLIMGLMMLLKKLWTARCSVSGTHILDAIRVPVSLYAAVWVFGLSSLWVGLSVLVRQQIGQLNVIVAWTAIALLLWRLIDIFAEAAQKKLTSNGRFFGVTSILFFLRRIIKVIFGIVVLIIVLDNLGVDVTAGLAALGIGGIALALGAQKTLENFIGSLAIVIDQPLHIGDYCKIGDVAGTVEDIGMRSTRLRSNDRTLITIPNGDLSTQRIENFARRNRFLINRQFQLRYDAKSTQIRQTVDRVQEILFAEEAINEEGRPARFIGFGEQGFVIEMFVYVNVSDYNEFLGIQQRLMLQIVEALEEIGVFFIIPAQTFLPALDQVEPKNPPVVSA